MQPKPQAIVKIALYPTGQVQCGLEGAGDKGFIARGLAIATQLLLTKVDQYDKDPTIEIPPVGVQKQLVRP